MAAVLSPYRWTLEQFVRAWEAGVFDGRVELVDGEVWPVPIGDWHGEAVGLLIRALPDGDHVVTASSLPSAGSLPDPDCWVRVRAAVGVPLGQRLSTWSPEAVALVAEVADETLDHDLGAKAALYARAGYGCYWAVTRLGVYEHTEPSPAGYEKRVLFHPGERIPVRYAGTDLAVDDLLPPT